MPIENIKHGDYIVELKPGASLYKEVTAPQAGAFGTRDLNGMNFSLGWFFLTQPFLMVADAHNHDFEQVIFFMGGDPKNVVDFDAEIEMGLVRISVKSATGFAPNRPPSRPNRPPPGGLGMVEQRRV